MGPKRCGVEITAPLLQMNIDLYLGFCLTSLALLITPGPIVTLIIANSLKHGTRSGFVTLAGSQVGLLVWIAIAALGLASVIEFMGPWFHFVRLAGAAYLAWLGLKLIFSHRKFSLPRPEHKRNFFLQGLFMNFSNPKSLLLFGALMPQFMTSSMSIPSQIFILGLTFLVLAALSDGLYAVAAGKARSWLSDGRMHIVEIISGLLLIAAAVWITLI